jgi:hypothetical protein
LELLVRNIQPRWFINNKVLYLNRWLHQFDSNVDPLPDQGWQHLAYTQPFFSVFDIDRVRRMMTVREIHVPFHMAHHAYFMYACLKCKEVHKKFIIDGIADR